LREFRKAGACIERNSRIDAVAFSRIRIVINDPTLQGRRLWVAGVSFEDRQDRLGHRSGRITAHYSAAELWRLIDAANSVCERGD